MRRRRRRYRGSRRRHRSRHPEIAANKPRTWDQFVALLKSLKAKSGSGPIALDSVAPGNDCYWLPDPVRGRF